MFRRRKSVFFDAGAEGEPKRIFFDILFVITGPLIVAPYSTLVGVIWTVLAAAFLVMDVVMFVRKQRKKTGEQAGEERQKALQTDQPGDQERKD